MDDIKSASHVASKNQFSLIKDEDLLKILNELRAAEAIAINNQASSPHPKSARHAKLIWCVTTGFPHQCLLGASLV
ncbi:DUF881 domain-containing protein [Sporomusa sphaeroides DSM 2875]|uniref:DUF881 domain-containing protein n=1 Tax=Sporomusa sphaeroides TaxID=47679 RepID=UPI00202F0723|nr:DUF881 domain-containing protein [Sporomusa sphaeroides]MCM0759513.1 DUF881 domain-containing protein [Sporomusa sphaeroides DSM 2875]